MVMSSVEAPPTAAAAANGSSPAGRVGGLEALDRGLAATANDPCRGCCGAGDTALGSYTHTHTHTHTHIHTRTHTYKHANIHIPTDTHIYARKHTHTHTHIHTTTHTCERMHGTHTHRNTHSHTHMETHAPLWSNYLRVITLSRR